MSDGLPPGLNGPPLRSVGVSGNVPQVLVGLSGGLTLGSVGLSAPMLYVLTGVLASWPQVSSTAQWSLAGGLQQT